MDSNPVLPSVRPVFRAVVETVAPRASSFDDGAWARAEALVENALAQRSPDVRRQVGIFLRLLDALPLLRHGKRFRRLDDARRVRFLKGLERSRILLLRRGLWGIRTLSYMGVYGQDCVRERIGYRATAEGWDARPGAITAATYGGGDG